MLTPHLLDPSPSIVWWRRDVFTHRFVDDLLRAELAALRPGQHFPRGASDLAGMHLIEDLGIDSLELMSISGALSDAVHMHESGIEDYLLAKPTVDDWYALVRYALEAFSARLSFRTSGSTGQPKSCKHDLWLLSQEAHELRRLSAGRRRVLCAVPCHHIYGFLTTVLLPQANADELLPVVDIRAVSPAGLSKMAQAGDLIVAYPAWWQAVLRGGITFPPDVAGLSSTAPCPAATASGLLDLGLTRLYELYGSSETAGIGWRARHDEPYRLHAFWHRQSGGGISRVDATGASHAAFCPDKLEWLSRDTFLPAGRIDAAVQVGGVNVYPERVRDVLLAHPAVKDAAVRLMTPREGNRLKAYIVPRDDSSSATLSAALEATLIEWVGMRLSVAERPRAFTIGPALPRNATGKLCDWPLLADEDEARALASSFFVS